MKTIVLAVFAAFTAAVVGAANVLPTPGSSAGYLYFPAAPSGAGGTGNPTVTGCYVGMALPVDALANPLPCAPGDPISASSTDSTIVGKYAGIETVSGKHLIAASADSADQAWCSTSLSPAIFGNSDTDGAANTTGIIKSCGAGYAAAKICRQIGGDWHLPARKEIIVLRNNRAAIGGFGSNYWTSTVGPGSGSESYNISTGGGVANEPRSSVLKVRCIRYF